MCFLLEVPSNILCSVDTIGECDKDVFVRASRRDRLHLLGCADRVIRILLFGFYVALFVVKIEARPPKAPCFSARFFLTSKRVCLTDVLCTCSGLVICAFKVQQIRNTVYIYILFVDHASKDMAFREMLSLLFFARGRFSGGDDLCTLCAACVLDIPPISRECMRKVRQTCNPRPMVEYGWLKRCIPVSA